MVAASVLSIFIACNVWAQLVPLGTPLKNRGYEQIKFKRGVRAYKHRSSSNIRIGAEGVMAAPLPEVEKALFDFERQVGKVDRLVESKILARGENWLVVYQRLNLPMINDRDFVLFVRRSIADNITTIAFHVVSKRGPAPRKGVVRVKLHQGAWQLRPTSDGEGTYARFLTTIDLGGMLPKWMARAGAGSELPRLFSAICKMACNPSQRSGTCLSKCR